MYFYLTALVVSLTEIPERTVRALLGVCAAMERRVLVENVLYKLADIVHELLA